MLGRAAPDADPEASQRRPRDSARVGAPEQLVPGLLVEAAQAPLVPPAVVVECDAPDEVPPHRVGLGNSWLGLKKEKKNWQTLFSII